MSNIYSWVSTKVEMIMLAYDGNDYVSLVEMIMLDYLSLLKTRGW